MANLCKKTGIYIFKQKGAAAITGYVGHQVWGEGAVAWRDQARAVQKIFLL